jgi:hypothetical protein
MPQITVNEIDQSVVTRVVSDDKVKILCPIITSFGPSFDGTADSVKTFTDVTDFNRAFGYTYAEFNPFEEDNSRMYARELIKKGGAVSVVRVNLGYDAKFNIEGISTDRQSTPTIDTVCSAAQNVPDLLKAIKDGTAVSGTLGQKNIVPGSIKLTLHFVNSSDSSNNFDITVNDYLKDGNFYCGGKGFTNNVCATVDYAGVLDTSTGTRGNSVITLGTATGYTVTVKDVTFGYYDGIDSWAKYTFCPQIESISAKYTGSFGNKLAIAISQVNTTRLAESYQYASISVYYIDRDVNYAYDETTKTSRVSSQKVKGITLLENKLVSTNPNSPDYFEDVEFEFITIKGTPSARAELGVVWSNIEAHPNSDVQYSGFPVVPLKYTASLSQLFNLDSFMSGGADFPYSQETLAKLMSGFKGYWASDNTWSVEDVNKYLEEAYTIIPNIYKSITDTYTEFTDPYIYDFDFITSSGFIYEEYDLDYVYKTDVALTKGSTGWTLGKTAPNTVTIVGTVEGSSTPVTYKDKPNEGSTTSGKLFSGETQVGTITYEDGVVIISTEGFQNDITATFADATIPKKPTVKIPVLSDADDGYDYNYEYYENVTPIHEAMLNLVNTRQDCVALFDLPRKYSKKKILDYSYMLNTSYGTIHHPWCWVNSPDIAGKQIIMVPSYIFLYTLLSNLINNVESQKWFPPAGVERATARVVTRPDYEIGSVILNDWQNDNISRVNPIMRLKQYGYVIYGQYTTLPAIDVNTHSALESLNVRLISNVVKKKIFDTCLNLAFEPNTSALWNKFYAQLDPFLRYMKYNQGLYDYRIVMDESTVTTDDINHLRCPGKVFIAPTRTAEFFDIDFIITGAGAEFGE